MPPLDQSRSLQEPGRIVVVLVAFRYRIARIPTDSMAVQGVAQWFAYPFPPV